MRDGRSITPSGAVKASEPEGTEGSRRRSRARRSLRPRVGVSLAAPLSASGPAPFAALAGPHSLWLRVQAGPAMGAGQPFAGFVPAGRDGQDADTEN